MLVLLSARHIGGRTWLGLPDQHCQPSCDLAVLLLDDSCRLEIVAMDWLKGSWDTARNAAASAFAHGQRAGEAAMQLDGTFNKAAASLRESMLPNDVQEKILGASEGKTERALQALGQFAQDRLQQVQQLSAHADASVRQVTQHADEAFKTIAQETAPALSKAQHSSMMTAQQVVGEAVQSLGQAKESAGAAFGEAGRAAERLGASSAWLASPVQWAAGALQGLTDDLISKIVTIGISLLPLLVLALCVGLCPAAAMKIAAKTLSGLWILATIPFRMFCRLSTDRRGGDASTDSSSAADADRGIGHSAGRSEAPLAGASITAVAKTAGNVRDRNQMGDANV